MGFERRVTFTYSGKPSNGTSKLAIILADRTVLTVTDDWNNYPVWGIVLHPAHLPERVVRARTSLLQEVRRSHPEARPQDIQAHLSRNLAVGDEEVRVILRHGRWAEPKRIVQFESRITHIEPA